MNIFKTHSEKIVLLFGFILILVAGFFSGYSYSQEQIDKQEIFIENPDESCTDFISTKSEMIINSQIEGSNFAEQAISSSKQVIGAFVASKNSTLYHKADCVYVKRIKEENMIFFNTAQEAEDRGLKLHCEE
ncbi:MAG: hypothetical protein KAI67_02550 [Candidatus Pacebacteria bacterium]|nr:hypothetical protein [Candidatus Paceibacterota bacterium]